MYVFRFVSVLFLLKGSSAPASKNNLPFWFSFSYPFIDYASLILHFFLIFAFFRRSNATTIDWFSFDLYLVALTSLSLFLFPFCAEIQLKQATILNKYICLCNFGLAFQSLVKCETLSKKTKYVFFKKRFFILFALKSLSNCIQQFSDK